MKEMKSRVAEDKSTFSKLLGDIFQTDTVSLRVALVEKVRLELSLYKAEHAANLDSNPLKW